MDTLCALSVLTVVLVCSVSGPQGGSHTAQQGQDPAFQTNSKDGKIFGLYRHNTGHFMLESEYPFRVIFQPNLCNSDNIR